MFLWSNNASYTDEAGVVKGNLNSDKAVEVFDMFRGMAKDGYVAVTESDGAEEFRSGKTAMYIHGTWPVAALEKAGVNFGIVDLPSFADAGREAVSILNASGIAMSKDSKNKEAAFEFIKYWTSEEMNKARIEYELPALKSVVESEGIMNNEMKAPFYTMLEQSAGFVPTSFITTEWTKLSDDLKLACERIYNPTTMENPKAVLDEIAAGQ